jgi:hypothetical protein
MLFQTSHIPFVYGNHSMLSNKVQLTMKAILKEIRKVFILCSDAKLVYFICRWI